MDKKQPGEARLFLGLNLFLFILNIPFLFDLAFLNHDSLSYFYSFYPTYNTFYYNKEFIQWLPYSTYGLPSFVYQLTALSICDYLMILAGGLLGVKNVLLLFKISLLLSQVIFLWGMFVLSSKLFKEKLAVLVACLTAVGSLVLKDQLLWGFYAFYLLPHILYYLLLFFESKSFKHLLTAMIIGVISTVGIVPYYLIIVMLELSVFFFFLMIHYRRHLDTPFTVEKKEFLKSICFFTVFVILAASFLYICFAPGLREHLKFISIGRGNKDYSVPLGNFLAYGGFIGMHKFADFIFPRLLELTASDLSLYMGYLGFFFVLYAFVKSRHYFSLALTSLVILLGFLSLGGFVSKILYYVFPGMKYYRHIGLSVSSFHLLFALLSGFGVEAYLKARKSEADYRRPVGLVIGLLAAGAFVYYFYTTGVFAVKIAAGYLIVLGLCVLVLIFLKRWSYKKKFQYLLIFGICLELTVFHVIIAAKNYDISRIRPPDVYVTPLKFQMDRSLSPPDKRSTDWFIYFDHLIAFQIASNPKFEAHSSIYSSVHNFLQWDPCQPRFRTDYLSLYVMMFADVQEDIVKAHNYSISEAMVGWLMCASPKLAISTNVLFVPTVDEAVETFVSRPDAHEYIILNNIPKNIQSEWENQPENKGTFEVLDYNPNRLVLKAAVLEEKGAWLYFADAYYPGWGAFVNGEKVPIYQANIAFKTVYLKQGESIIKFEYGNPGMLTVFYILIGSGIIFAVGCFFSIGRFLYKDFMAERKKINYS